MSAKHRIGVKIPVAITIASSDCRGGAGIQADLKTFAVLGVHGTTAITSVTAQEGSSPVILDSVTTMMIKRQIAAVAGDMHIDAGKTGMLSTCKIIKTVASETSKHGFPLVVDPVMVTKSGTPILKKDAVSAMREYLIPKATVATPNIPEAELLTGIRIKTIADAKASATRIADLGPRAVVVKGGRLSEEESVDVLYYRGHFRVLRAPRFHVSTVRGSGCTFSAAIAAQLAKGQNIPSAVQVAKRLVTIAIKSGLRVGKQYGPVNPMAYLASR